MDLKNRVSELAIENSELAGKVAALESMLMMLITFIDNPNVTAGLKEVLSNEETIKGSDDPEYVMGYLQVTRAFRDLL